MIDALCNKCHKTKAVFYVVDVAGGIKRELFFCSKCVGEMGLQFYSVPISLMQDIIPTDIKCDSCGMTLSQYNAIKRVGCAKDYDLFNLVPVLESYHHASQHVGKIPTSVEYGKEVSVLRSALKEAIGKENYEEAAKIRDLIKQKEQYEA